MNIKELELNSSSNGFVVNSFSNGFMYRRVNSFSNGFVYRRVNSLVNYSPGYFYKQINRDINTKLALFKTANLFTLSFIYNIKL
jgi:hypothetical protein